MFCLLLVSDGFCQACVEVPDFSIQHRHKIRAQLKSCHWWYHHHFTTRYSPRQTWTNLNLTCLQCQQSQRGLHGKYRVENPRVQSCPRGVRQRCHTEEQQQLTIRKIHPAVFQCVGAIYKLSLPTGITDFLSSDLVLHNQTILINTCFTVCVELSFQNISKLPVFLEN